MIPEEAIKIVNKFTKRQVQAMLLCVRLSHCGRIVGYRKDKWRICKERAENYEFCNLCKRLTAKLERK